MARLVTETPTTVLAVYAHPNDVEISCGATLLRWVGDGARLHLVICTSGDKGSSDPSTVPAELVEVRAAEARAAAEVLGASSLDLLGYPDGEIENTVELRGRLVGRIRSLRPDVVVCPDPTAIFFGDGYLNHHDHRAVGWACLDACAPAASSPLYYPAAGPAHRVATVYCSGTLEPDAFVDVATTLPGKVAAVQCHRSQLGEGVSFVPDVVDLRAREAGRRAGIRYAEGFRALVLG